MCDRASIHADKIGVAINHGVVLQIIESLQISSRLSDRPPQWVPRSELVQRIAAVFDAGQQGVALSSVLASGDGGQGKSVLASLYAHQYRDRYPKGRLILNCGGATLTNLLSALFPSGLGNELSLPERASLVRTALCREPGFLLVLDNVDGREHWERLNQECADPGNSNTRLMPTAPCHIVVTCRESLPALKEVSVDRLTDDECRELLAQLYSITNAEDEVALKIVVRETEGIALLVAAIGASLAEGEVSLTDYANWLVTVPIERLPDGQDPLYGRKIASILDDILDRLHPAEYRCLEYAAYLPQDAMRPEWLLDLLSKDPIDRGTDSIDRKRQPQNVLGKVQHLNLIRNINLERLSLHRLLGKRIREKTKSKITVLKAITGMVDAINTQGIYAAMDGYHADALNNFNTVSLIREGLFYLGESDSSTRNDLANAYVNLGLTHHGLGDFPSAKEDYRRAIEIQETLRIELEPFNCWHQTLKSDMATTLMNRGTTLYFTGDLLASKTDFDRAIELQESLREELEHSGRWTTALRNELATTYMNRGNALLDLGDLPAARDGYDHAIRIRETLRQELTPLGKWGIPLKHDLANVYLNRGNTLDGLGDFSAAIEDFDRAIEIHETLRKELGEQNKWPPTFRNALAAAYVNRGNAQRNLGDILAAKGDYDESVNIREILRQELESSDEWLPAFRNDLAVSYSNRGCVLDGLNDFPSAKSDFHEAIRIQELLRDELAPLGKWPPVFCSNLASSYANRGSAQYRRNEIAAAKNDGDQAIRLLLALREEHGSLPPAMQRTLATAYMDRGNALKRLGYLEAAKGDHDQAIGLLNTLKEELEPVGLWLPALSGLLANTYMNRGVLGNQLGDSLESEKDLNKAVLLYGDLQERLEPLGQWSPILSINVASALINRGNLNMRLFANLNSKKDYDQAIQVLETLQQELDVAGNSLPILEHLAVAHLNRAMLHTQMGLSQAADKDQRKAKEFREKAI